MKCKGCVISPFLFIGFTYIKISFLIIMGLSSSSGLTLYIMPLLSDMRLLAWMNGL